MKVLIALAVALAVVCSVGFVFPHTTQMSSAELAKFYQVIADLSGMIVVLVMLATVVAVARDSR